MSLEDNAVTNSIKLICKYLNEKGRILNPDFDHCKLFSTMDIPDLKTILVPTYEPSGPFGAKSIAEIGINGPLPAIANAIYDAAGVRIREAPLIPEKVLTSILKNKVS